MSSFLTGLIVAAVCSAILSTTGQAVQAELQVLARIDAAGTRSIVISDPQGNARIPVEAVDRLARLSGVEWALGLGPATDMRASGNPAGRPVAIRALHGDLPPEIEVLVGDLGPDRALVGPLAQAMLGLIHPYGGVAGDGVEVAVAGAFEAEDPLLLLNRNLLVAPGPSDTAIRAIHVLVRQPSDVVFVAEAARALLGADDPTLVAVETSEVLAEIRATVGQELDSFGRRLVAIVLGVGLVLVGLNVYGAVTTQRNAFGRRRVLGASRPVIVALVVAQTSLVGFVGAVTGVLATTVVLLRFAGSPSSAIFAIAVGVLSVLVAVVAALPPAILAAYRDPVRILRVP